MKLSIIMLKFTRREVAIKLLPLLIEDSAAVASMLNAETTSAGYAMMSKKEEFRKHAWAIYNAPSKPDPFGVCFTREELIAIDKEHENKW